MMRRLFLVAGAVSALLAQSGSPVFRSNVHLVEVYATVFDHKGNYLDGLDVHSFQVLDDGKPQPIVSFESSQVEFSCAVLLDTTGSMSLALPALKNAVLRLIDVFRDEDSLAIYGFNTSVQVLQDFTHDKQALRSAVLRARPGGETALYDALTETAQEIGKRNGKKTMIVFTDGEDNSSVLNVTAALSRIKKLGIPVYTIAEGEAVTSVALSRTLKEISSLSGGVAYTVKKTQDIDTVFAAISEDMKHGYMLTFRAPEAHGFLWRKIQLVVNDPKDCRVRYREGYLP